MASWVIRYRKRLSSSGCNPLHPFLGTFSKEKLTLFFVNNFLHDDSPTCYNSYTERESFKIYLLQTVSFYFIFSSLNLYCHSKFSIFSLQHLKPDFQEQSRGNEKPCPVIYWALTLQEHWYYWQTHNLLNHEPYGLLPIELKTCSIIVEDNLWLHLNSIKQNLFSYSCGKWS